MSDRFRGYDDEYGYKSRDRVSSGDAEYYRKEKKYHDDDYHEDRDRQRTKYNDSSESFDRASTKGIKKEYKQLWPRSGDSKEFKDYLRTERTGYFDPPSRRSRDDQKRQDATRDNRHADRDRRSNRIETEDFGYPSDNLLRRDYRTARNVRDDPLGDSGGGGGGSSRGREDEMRRDRY
ncbi:hypothetical protein CLCR_05198 [Cladophialophora carrionii]|uniref:Uncharacterized protein n=1 Tax=Cladophialophora carrionii TaxID=86049 RepID=A0A1C1CLJ6_9EURO|nr:hypothetical protein CLCR_05198 [Cladophialophora carrionii]